MAKPDLLKSNATGLAQKPPAQPQNLISVSVDVNVDKKKNGVPHMFKSHIQTEKDIVIRNKSEKRSILKDTIPLPILSEINTNKTLPWLGDKDNIEDEIVKDGPTFAKLKAPKE